MRLFWILIGVFVSVTISAQTSVPPADGDGTSANPYRIASLENLCWIAQNPSSWGSDFKQVSHIDASSTATWYPNGDGTYQGWDPIGNSTVNFTGYYNGNGKYISGLYINRPAADNIGLFGKIRNPDPQDGRLLIRKLYLLDVNITGKDHTGALVGYSHGWFAGSYDWPTMYRGFIDQCHVSGVVNGNQNVGGLAGYMDSMFLNLSHSSCTVNGVNKVGGLVGRLYYHTVCYRDYSVGPVYAGNESGGLAGYASQYIEIIHCYSSGLVGPATNAGGLLGSGGASASTSYWDTQTSNRNSSVAGVARTTAQMKTLSQYHSDWAINQPDGHWWMIDGQTRPVIKTEYSSSIFSAHQLQLMQNNPGADYSLIRDIDLSCIQDPSEVWGTSPNGEGGFVPVGTLADPFTGTFNGNDHVVSNLYMKRETTDHQSLFGRCDAAAISNLDLIDGYVKGQTYTAGLSSELINSSEIIHCSYQGTVHATWQHSGGLVGYLNGGILNYCFSAGSVIGSSWLGGLAGSTMNGAAVSNSFCRASVNGNGRVGGLIGNSANDTVSDCYSTGLVSGFSFVGGLIGEKNNGITSNCFWDVETSWQTTSDGDGATGLTTAEMTTQSTFSNAGWNFASVWAMQAETNDGYPYLIWGQIIAPPEPPTNVTIIQVDDNVQISWEAVTGASSYKVFSCGNPDGDFLEDLSGIFDGNNWTAPAADTDRFYDVRTVRD